MTSTTTVRKDSWEANGALNDSCKDTAGPGLHFEARANENLAQGPANKPEITNP